jgi:hypothetical protein
MTHETGTVRTEGRTLHVGRRTATAEARIVDAKGRLLATPPRPAWCSSFLSEVRKSPVALSPACLRKMRNQPQARR